MSGTGLRTVWLTLRATNYTTAVFTNVITNLSGFDAATKRAINSSLNLGKSAMAVGMITGVLGQQIGGTAGQILTYASYLAYFVGMLAYAKAGILAINGVLQAHNIIVHMATGSWLALGFAVAGAFAIFFLLKDSLGVIPALILAIVAALVILIASLIIINALGGRPLLSFLSIGQSTAQTAFQTAGPEFTEQMGTRMIPHTGLGLLHAGEVVYNPATGRPTQIGNDLSGRNGGGLTTIDASIHADTINTKADIEELNNLLKKQGRTLAQNNR